MDQEQKVASARPKSSGAFGWKALSPFVFAMAVIMGIAINGTVGLLIVVAAFLNLVYGMTGWNSYVPGQK